MTTSTFSCNTSALVSYTDMGKVTLEGGIGPANQLNVAGGSEGGETWSASTQIVGSAFGVVIQGTTGATNTLLGPPIYATRIADLSLDTMPVTMNGSALPSPGNNTFIVNDLSLTGIQNVTVNAHKSQMLDAKHDTITVNSSQINADNVVVANNGVEQNQISNLEDVTLSPLSQTGPWPLIPYTVAAAITNPGDKLTVNLYGGNNVVQVNSTAGPGGTIIDADTGDGQVGNNQFTVGNAGDPFGLDNIQGPLSIDAGNGTGNSIKFTEATAYAGDTLTLTNNSLIRYSPSAVWGIPAPKGAGYKPIPAHTRYPFTISYKATGGALRRYCCQRQHARHTGHRTRYHHGQRHHLCRFHAGRQQRHDQHGDRSSNRLGIDSGPGDHRL